MNSRIQNGGHYQKRLRNWNLETNIGGEGFGGKSMKGIVQEENGGLE